VKRASLVSQERGSVSACVFFGWARREGRDFAASAGECVPWRTRRGPTPACGACARSWAVTGGTRGCRSDLRALGRRRGILSTARHGSDGCWVPSFRHVHTLSRVHTRHATAALATPEGSVLQIATVVGRRCSQRSRQLRGGLRPRQHRRRIAPAPKQRRRKRGQKIEDSRSLAGTKDVTGRRANDGPCSTSPGGGAEERRACSFAFMWRCIAAREGRGK
jgi:hypothetical protein